MVLTVNSISKSFGTQKVLDDIQFTLFKGEIVSIIGPSGSGKTTLLKIIAGLETPSSGSIDFKHPPGKDNPVVLVFQDYVLFPNLTVYENIAFGLRVRKTPQDEVEANVGEFLQVFGIREQQHLFPAELSAGQRQRTAIARAMIIKPSVLLLDEPFANLDKNLKVSTAEFIRNTQKQFGVTTIGVTHDQEEAFAMSDKIGILLEGKLIQYDSVREVYFNPASIEAAAFLGPVNIVPREYLRWFEGTEGMQTDKKSLVVRAESIELEKRASGEGIVEEAKFIGISILYTVNLHGLQLHVYSLSANLKKGDRVALYVKYGMIRE